LLKCLELTTVPAERMSAEEPPTAFITLWAVVRPRSWLGRRVGSGYESQIGPTAGIPRRSRPWTTRQVTVLLLMQTTASALESRHAAYAAPEFTAHPGVLLAGEGAGFVNVQTLKGSPVVVSG
jgi:hypothetical protein